MPGNQSAIPMFEVSPSYKMHGLEGTLSRKLSSNVVRFRLKVGVRRKEWRRYVRAYMILVVAV